MTNYKSNNYFRQKLQNIEIVQMSYQNNQTLKGYTSLESSTVTIPSQTHLRTQSYSKLPAQPVHNFTHTRAPSQKKLSLTCQNIPLPGRSTHRDAEGQMKKKGQGYIQKYGQFVSMGSSRVIDNESVYSKAEAENNYLTQMKQTFEQKLKKLQSFYSQAINDYMGQVRQLQKQLCLNARQLQYKEQKIQELESIVRQGHEKVRKANQKKDSLVQKKINDLQIKIRIIADHIQENSSDQHSKVDILTEKIVSYFGHKFTGLKEKSSYYLQASFHRINELYNELEDIKNRHEKHSEGTRGSLESVGSELSIGNKVQHRQDPHGASFYDDCFFYPTEHHSEDYEFIVEMSRNREHPLSCWIDEYGRIRYADTNSFIFNRKGDLVILPREEIQSLVSQNLMILC